MGVARAVGVRRGRVPGRAGRGRQQQRGEQRRRETARCAAALHADQLGRAADVAVGVPERLHDQFALDVLGSILSGRTGRLYKSLVLDQKIATNAGATNNAMKWEGYFQLTATAAPGKKPEEVEQALYKEIEKLGLMAVLGLKSAVLRTAQNDRQVCGTSL